MLRRSALQFRAHDAAITALGWHPTRAILATGSEDLTVKLWDLDTLKLIEELRGPEATVRSVAFSPSGRRLACLAMTPRAFVWEPESPQALIAK